MSIRTTFNGVKQRGKSIIRASGYVVKQSNGPSTSIEELSPEGYELSEEHLRFVYGGMRPIGDHSAGTSCNPGASDDD